MVRPPRRGYFTQRPVYPWELPRIMRKHIYTGAMGNIWGTLVDSLFFVYFGTRIGLSRFQWGLMTGISYWLIAAQLLSAFLTERIGRRKLIWFCLAMAERSLRLVGVLVALGLWYAGWSAAGLVLMITVCLSSLFGTMASPPWMSWLADIIPEAQHGTFLGRRSAWIALAVIVVAVPAGLWIDQIPPAWKVEACVAVFVVATVIGIADLVIHGTIPEPAMRLPGRSDFWRHVLVPLRDRRFRRWLNFNAVWTFSMNLGGTLSTLYFVDELALKDNFLGGTVVLTGFVLLGSLCTSRWSGRLVDRVGVKPVLFWAHLAWSGLPAFWLVASPDTVLVCLGLSSLIGGTASTAASNAANKLITRLPPPEHRAMYAAVSSSLGSLAGGVGVIAAGTFLGLVGDRTVQIGSWAVSGFHWLFMLSLGLRLASALLLIRRIGELHRHGDGTVA